MRNPLDHMRGPQRGAEDVKPRRSVAQAIKDAIGRDAYDKVTSPSTQMSLALGQKPVYAGTVAKATVLRRRAANKRARAARRVHRLAAR